MPVQSTVARGEVAPSTSTPSLGAPGVIAAIWHGNAPRLAAADDAELAVLQSPRVAYRGQFVAVVVAETLEAAREAAAAVRVEYGAEPHDVELRADHPGLYPPEQVNPVYPADTENGDPDAALAAAAVVVDATYTHPGRAQQPDGAARDGRRAGTAAG